MQSTPLTLALVATFSWGLWAFFSKLAGRTLAPDVTLVVTYVVGSLFGVGYLLYREGVPTLSTSGLGYGILGGAFFGVGGLSYYAALKTGSTSVTTTVAALYFAVTTVLAVFVLGESLAPQEVAGLALATVAVVLLAS